MPSAKGLKEPLQFCTVKCKLSSILSGGRAPPALDVFLREAVTAHEMTKQATAFFKAYCLCSNEVPPVCHSTMVACLQQVTTRSPKGSKGKESELSTKMEKFWKEKFCKIYPEKVNTIGKSLIKANIADQMTNCILTNATTHFRSRCTRLCTVLGLNRTRSQICVSNAFKGKWQLVDSEVKETLRRVIPTNPTKGCVIYDMKKRPSE